MPYESAVDLCKKARGRFAFTCTPEYLYKTECPQCAADIAAMRDEINELQVKVAQRNVSSSYSDASNSYGG